MKSIKLKSLLIVLTLSLMFFSCSPKDADIQKAITEKMATTPEMSGITATVSEGVVTLSGQCKDEACKASCETIIKGVKGVKSIVNNCSIPAPVVIKVRKNGKNQGCHDNENDRLYKTTSVFVNEIPYCSSWFCK